MTNINNVTISDNKGPALEIELGLAISADGLKVMSAHFLSY